MSPFRDRYISRVRELANELRHESMPELTEELFALFETTGNRLKYEDVYFARRKMLAVYGMAALIFKREEDIDKLQEILLEVCDEECWALPAHVDRRNEDWRHTVDLFASETAHTLMEIISLLEEALPSGRCISRDVGDRVREEVEKRVLTPVFSSEPNYPGWECVDTNWNAVCAGAIGSACIYMMQGKDEERLEKCLDRICHSLTFYLDGFKDDGTCMEGIGYFTYGMTYYVGFAELLYRYSKGKRNLFDNEKLQKIAQFQQKMYFRSGRTVSFSDGEQKAKFRMGLTRFLADKYEGVVIPNEELAAEFTFDTCYRFMGLCRDYLWTEETDVSKSQDMGEESRKVLQGEVAVGQKKVPQGEAVAEQEEKVRHREAVAERDGTPTRHDILPTARWSVCESKNGVGMAAKGGDNDEPHNHNDIGSFMYVIGEEFLLTDLGAGEYTKDYFREGRYDILCNSSKGHSVPVINGKLQKAGKQYCAGSFSADGCGETTIEFAGAYPEGVVQFLERKMDFSLENGSLMVTDSFELVGDFTEVLVTQEKVSLGEREITIQGKRHTCTVQLPEQIRNLRVTELSHSNHQGEAELVYLISWDVMPNLDESAGAQLNEAVCKEVMHGQMTCGDAVRKGSTWFCVNPG